MNVTRVKRRLFGRWDVPGEDPPIGAEYDFGGLAANVVFDDVHQLRVLDRTATARQRLDAVYGWFRKVQVNGRRLARAYGDEDALTMIDEVCEEVAERLLFAMSEIREGMVERGYDD
ncbi:hypothetical protein NLX85_18315 [Micromonospora sp. A3M-1-15]|uniref:hypothetical protein n=1 Tax=Micromonospora sp. A3M-1-15 TaxID=2962035 RepID=UPI0020B8C560|nr:hypothetical protein [Micromonospora sp. A3M-1-15]MCP3785318.1 hypothetical protein [Micromonospora sp. A3M-1-15]